MAVDMNIKELLVIGDSDILIHKVQEEWSTKNVKILLYLHCVKELCKKFTKIEFNRVPPNDLKVMGSLWSFAAWGIDMIGPIEPAASNVHHFILVDIHYFTKWVEASTYKAVTEKEQTPQRGNIFSSRPNYNAMRGSQPISGPRIHVQDDQ
ncbi:uncharacterized protein [Nicotiana tomentosiformis]|uniref:uncharacterized protein n=1 Tax=Nicotiana tomentosiformis TaxID=4098 RepID=UPI00388CCAB1